ncbi:MAG: four helix bundle protein [Salinivirgaceae bacterium]|nr:four helix bundle protein [Salinivirgaceae bacterium]
MEFANSVLDVVDTKLPENKHRRLKGQVEAASVSVASNIAEGKGRWLQKEFVHFLFIARGSLFETVSLLTIFKMRGYLTEIEYNELLSKAAEISKMLSGLID